MEFASSSLLEPAGPDPLIIAFEWVQGVFFGETAIVAATLAVAAFGYFLLVGRIDVRRGVGVILGCFLIFGAGTIAAALGSHDTTSGSRGPAVTAQVMPLKANDVVVPAYDPYAGAAVPDIR